MAPHAEIGHEGGNVPGEGDGFAAGGPGDDDGGVVGHFGCLAEVGEGDIVVFGVVFGAFFDPLSDGTNLVGGEGIGVTGHPGLLIGGDEPGDEQAALGVAGQKQRSAIATPFPAGEGGEVEVGAGIGAAVAAEAVVGDDGCDFGGEADSEFGVASFLASACDFEGLGPLFDGGADAEHPPVAGFDTDVLGDGVEFGGGVVENFLGFVEFVVADEPRHLADLPANLQQFLSLITRLCCHGSGEHDRDGGCEQDRCEESSHRGGGG